MEVRCARQRLPSPNQDRPYERGAVFAHVEQGSFDRGRYRHTSSTFSTMPSLLSDWRSGERTTFQR